MTRMPRSLIDELAANLGIPARLVEDPYAEAARAPTPTGRRFVATFLDSKIHPWQIQAAAALTARVNLDWFAFTLTPERYESFKPRTLQIVEIRGDVERWSGRPIVEVLLAELDGPSLAHDAAPFDFLDGGLFDSLPEERIDV